MVVHAGSGAGGPGGGLGGGGGGDGGGGLGGGGAAPISGIVQRVSPKSLHSSRAISG